MTSDSQTRGGGFVIAADEGEAFWFLNTLTINKVGCGDTDGRLCIVDHRVPPGFAPPPHFTRQATRRSSSWTAKWRDSAATRSGGPAPAH